MATWRWFPVVSQWNMHDLKYQNNKSKSNFVRATLTYEEALPHLIETCWNVQTCALY